MFDPPYVSIEDSLNRLRNYCRQNSRHIYDWASQIHSGLIFSKKPTLQKSFDRMKEAKPNKFQDPAEICREDYQQICVWTEGMYKEILKAFRVPISEEQAGSWFNTSRMKKNDFSEMNALYYWKISEDMERI